MFSQSEFFLKYRKLTNKNWEIKYTFKWIMTVCAETRFEINANIIEKEKNKYFSWEYTSQQKAYAFAIKRFCVIFIFTLYIQIVITIFFFFNMNTYKIFAIRMILCLYHAATTPLFTISIFQGLFNRKKIYQFHWYIRLCVCVCVR